MFKQMKEKSVAFYRSIWFPLVILIVGFITVCTLISFGYNSLTEKQLIEYKDHIYKVDFEGHTYLMFIKGYKAGICHDQNCICKKKTNQ